MMNKILLIIMVGMGLLIGILGIVGSEEKEVIIKSGELDLTSINYKNDNMTVEFIKDSGIIGEATLKSHNTYNEIRKVTSGNNRVVVWYEFSNFKEEQLLGTDSVEFIDLRENIVDSSVILKEGEEPKIIPNSNYNLPINKTYHLVYKDKSGKWVDYNSKVIPIENIIIGVQTDLGWGELLDVRFNILGNELDRHAVVIGVNSGFVTVAPVDDPLGTEFTIDFSSILSVDTSPITAKRIVEMGWWCDNETEEANFEVGFYSANGTVVPGEAGYLLEASRTNAKGTTAGWKRVTGLNWSIESNTTYWLSVQVDNTATATRSDRSTTGSGYDQIAGRTTLPNPANGGGYLSAKSSVYAVWEEEPSGVSNKFSLGGSSGERVTIGNGIWRFVN